MKIELAPNKIGSFEYCNNLNPVSSKTLEHVWYVYLNNSFQFFRKYMWVKKYVKILVNCNVV